MPARSMTDKVGVAFLTSPVAITATDTSLYFDTKGWEEVEIIINETSTAVDSSHYYTPTLQSSTASGSGFATSTEYQGTTLASQTTNTSTVRHIGYTGTERYIKVVMTETGTTAASTIAVTVIASRPLDTSTLTMTTG